MANTFVLLASTTVGSGGASSIDFTSIPATYTDLVVKVSGRIDYAQTGDYFKITFNLCQLKFFCYKYKIDVRTRLFE